MKRKAKLVCFVYFNELHFSIQPAVYLLPPSLQSTTGPFSPFGCLNLYTFVLATYLGRIFALSTIASEMPTTRLESAGQIDALLEELKQSSGLCVITKDSLELLIRDNINLHTATQQLNERLVESIEKLNTFHERNEIVQTESRRDLNEHLDTLIERISINNSLSQQDVFDIESELKKRKDIIEKLTRNQEISKYYDELLNEPEPFVRPEFRTRVNKNTHERELVHRRQQSIERVKTEIKVMEDRVAEWTEKKNELDRRIEEYLITNEEKRADTERQMETQVRTIKENFERTSLAKLKKSDDDEKLKSFEYLVKVTDNSNDALNYRGQSSRARQRRGRGQNRSYPQEY